MSLAIKGRGIASNKSGRFETLSYEVFDDGWGGATHENTDVSEDAQMDAQVDAQVDVHDANLASNKPSQRIQNGQGANEKRSKGKGFRQTGKTIRTSLSIDTARSVITRNHSPDIPFDRSINPYRGCEHGCVYCFARPTHAYLGLSPGLDFETKLFYKPNAPELLRRELSYPSYTPQPIALGTNTDPYQPTERDKELTRAILKVLAAFNNPFTIVTKSALVLRDLDLIQPMAQKNMARVYLSITTLDNKLSHTLEPRASAPKKRLETLKALSQAGVPCGVLAAPVIPALNESEIEAIAQASAQAGASSLGYVLLRLPLEIKDLFADWLGQHKPDRARRILSLVMQTRDGKLNNAEFGSRMRGTGPIADMIAQRFQKARKRYGLSDGRDRGRLDCSHFKDPNAIEQLHLL